MGKKLTAAQIDQYHRDGYVYPIDAFGAEQARCYRAAMEKFEAAQGTELTKGHNFKPHLLFTWVDEIVHNPAILDAVEDLMARIYDCSISRFGQRTRATRPTSAGTKTRRISALSRPSR